MRLLNISTGIAIATDVRRPQSVFARIRGFIGRRVEPDEGLWFDGCCAIHTVGMRAPLDVVFLDRAHRVIKVLPRVPPLRLAVFCHGAHVVVELCSGTVSHHDVLRGDVLTLVG